LSGPVSKVEIKELLIENIIGVTHPFTRAYHHLQEKPSLLFRHTHSFLPHPSFAWLFPYLTCMPAGYTGPQLSLHLPPYMPGSVSPWLHRHKPYKNGCSSGCTY